MELITGIAGKPHITPLHDSMIYEAITGQENTVFRAFEELKIDIVSNNSLVVHSGLGMIQGRMFCVLPGATESITIENGRQGESRVDLITARFTEMPDGTQKIEFAVLKGDPNDNFSSYNKVVKGDLNSGEKVSDFPLWTVNLEGINIVSIKPMFKLQGGLSKKEEDDSGVVQLPLNGSKFKFGGTADKNYHSFYRKIGKQVTISFAVVTATSVNTSTAQTIANLPSEITPKEEFDNVAFNSGGRYFINVSPRGNLTLNGTNRIDSGQIVRGTISYFV